MATQRCAEQYDAIVVGAGAAGGLASLLLTEAHLRVLTLDAGWRPPMWRAPYRRAVAALTPRLAALRHATFLPSVLSEVGQRGLKALGLARQPTQSKFFAWMLAPHLFVDDREHPYSSAPGSTFQWFRVHHLGGRMLSPGHGRLYYRLDDDVFSNGWPLRAEDIAPWYDEIERRLGGGDANPELTDSERDALSRLRARWPHADATVGRSAPPLASIEAASATGRLTCQQGAHVSRLCIGKDGHIEGVLWTDVATGDRHAAKAPIVFLCASALESTRILLCSRSDKTGRAPGAASDALGRFIADHVTVTASGDGPPLTAPEAANPGRCIFVRHLDPSSRPAHAPFTLQIYRWSQGERRSHFTCVSFAEMKARRYNHVTLDEARRDIHGNPTLRIACTHGAADLAIAAKQSQTIREIADTLEVSVRRIDAAPARPGTAMHEFGGARMGDDPATSVLDPFNQCWDAKGLYVTDAAAFPSQGVHHPTLTIMALTARACAHATRATPVGRNSNP